MFDLHEQLIQMEALSSVAQGGKRLHDIGFDLYSGETHVLLSTFAYNQRNFCDLLTGSILRYTGRFDLLGKPLTAKSRLEKDVQVIGLEPLIFPSLSVAENIMIGNLRPRWFVRLNAIEHSMRLMERTGIALNICKPVSSMTFDELKTIELLRICANEPRIVVFFDAINYLGSENRGLIPKVIRYLKRRGCGIIYLTSSFEEALALGDRISVLDSGTIKGTFPVEDVRRNPGEIAYLLSGWESLVGAGQDEDDLAVLEAMANIDNLMRSDAELRRVIEHIAKDLVKALGADSAVIYLVEDERMSDVISSGDGALPLPMLRHTDVMALLQDSEELVFQTGDEAFHRLFLPNELVQTIVCYPLRMDGKKNALIQVMFSHTCEFTGKLPVYLRMYAREVVMAIETSRRLGNSVLLQETHHRIKNNLQMVHNLLYLQKVDAQTADTVDVCDILDTAMHRIKCISSVHALLCRDWFGRNVVNLKTLILEIMRMYQGMGVEMVPELDETSVAYNDAISLSLATNELIANCIKHAFPQDQPDKKITIRLRNTGADIRLSVCDNGVGLSPGFSADETQSVGMSIIKSIVSELQGTLNYRKPASGAGTEAHICFERQSISPVVALKP